MNSKNITKTILLLNAEFGGNKGAEAMLITVISVLYNRGFRGNIYVERSTSAPVFYSKQMCTKLSLDGLSVEMMTFRPKQILKNLIFGYRTEKGNKILPDLVIDIGGLAFCDNSLKGSLRTWFRYLPLQIRGVKYIFYTQDFGPIRRLGTKIFALLVLAFTKHIYTRSEFSRKELEQCLPILKNKILGPYPDITLLLNPVDSNSLIKFDREYIIICPSQITWKKYGDSYITFLTKIAEHFKEAYQIVIMVHTFYHNGQLFTDEYVAKLLHKQIESSFIFSENIDPREIKYLISGSSLLITSRYHALVAGLSTGIPSVAIGWNEKYQSLLQLYGIVNFNLKFDTDELNYDFDKWLDQDLLPQLHNRNKELKKLVDASFDKLLEDINFCCSN